MKYSKTLFYLGLVFLILSKSAGEQVLVLVEPENPEFGESSQKEIVTEKLREERWKRVYQDALRQKNSRTIALRRTRGKSGRGLKKSGDSKTLQSLKAKMSQLESAWLNAPEENTSPVNKEPLHYKEFRKSPAEFMETTEVVFNPKAAPQKRKISYIKEMPNRDKREKESTLAPLSKRLGYQHWSRSYRKKRKAVTSSPLQGREVKKAIPGRSLSYEKRRENARLKVQKKRKAPPSGFQGSEESWYRQSHKKRSDRLIKRDSRSKSGKGDYSYWNAGLGMTRVGQGSSGALNKESRVTVARNMPNGNQILAEYSHANDRGASMGKLRKVKLGYKHYMNGYEDQKKMNPYVALMLEAWRANFHSIEGMPTAYSEREALVPGARLGTEISLTDRLNLDVFLETTPHTFEYKTATGARKKLEFQEINLGMGMNYDF